MTHSIDGPDPRDLIVRQVRTGDAEGVIGVMTRARSHFVGARHPRLYSAIVNDALRPSPTMSVTVAVDDGEIVGFIATTLGSSRSYWRRFAVRHPLATAAIVEHRLRKARSRFTTRRRDVSEYAVTPSLVPDIPLPDEVAARLDRRPPESGSPVPGEHGPRIAEVLYVGVLPEQRGRGTGVGMYASLFEHLRAAGFERCDASFALRDPAAIRMHCTFPFTIYRLPGGYWGSLRLADLPSGHGGR